MIESAFFYFSIKTFETVVISIYISITKTGNIYQIINICLFSFCFLLPHLVHFSHIRKDASKFWNITERKTRGGEGKLKIF